MEKEVKDAVNTGLGAITLATENFEELRQNTIDFVDAKQAEIEKFFDELQLKGQTDKSEFSVEVREKVKEGFKALSEYELKAKELFDEYYARLRVELGKYDIDLPEFSDIQLNIENTINSGKEKINSLIQTEKEENATAEDAQAA